ncbi:MAG: hypoxanthine phosphoribosyltransferase [Simkaniaceae bacterium]
MNNQTLSKNHLELLIREEIIAKRLLDVAEELNQKFQDRQVVLVSIMKGAVCLTADLMRLLSFPFALEWIECKSYGMKGVQKGTLNIRGLEELVLENQHVILIDDIFDSGETLFSVYKKILEKNPASVTSLVLLAKNVPRDMSYFPDFVLFNIEDRFVVGYGLDYKEQYRGLPGIYAYGPSL